MMIPTSTSIAPVRTSREGASPTMAHAAKIPTGSSLEAMIETMPVVSLGLAKLMSDVGSRMPRMANSERPGDGVGCGRDVGCGACERGEDETACSKHRRAQDDGLSCAEHTRIVEKKRIEKSGTESEGYAKRVECANAAI